MRCHGFEVLASHQVMVVVFVICSFSSFNEFAKSGLLARHLSSVGIIGGSACPVWFSDTVIVTSRGCFVKLLPPQLCAPWI